MPCKRSVSDMFWNLRTSAKHLLSNYNMQLPRIKNQLWTTDKKTTSKVFFNIYLFISKYLDERNTHFMLKQIEGG